LSSRPTGTARAHTDQWAYDPPGFPPATRIDEDAVGHYRWIRDETRAFVELLPGGITGGEASSL